ncbi:MAG: nucleotide exchange factor GrpE [Polyangiaceae bacterium]|nr:nucleotide exchange factor GrpE [Polyangiaceae bacterium]
MHGETRGTDDPQAEGLDEGSVQSSEATSGEPSAVADAADPLAQAQAEAARLKDAWLRAVADFDNFRKRSRRELEDARRSGREDVVRALLPVFDNLERALQSAQRSTDVKSMADGLSMVQRQFIEALGREGIARVATVGSPFDPTVHEAIQQVETDEHLPGTIIAEVQPGYTQGDRLLRAAMVVVARAKTNANDGPTRPSQPSN